jgi:hypothetical protein
MKIVRTIYQFTEIQRDIIDSSGTPISLLTTFMLRNSVKPFSLSFREENVHDITYNVTGNILRSDMNALKTLHLNCVFPGPRVEVSGAPRLSVFRHVYLCHPRALHWLRHERGYKICSTLLQVLMSPGVYKKNYTGIAAMDFTNPILYETEVKSHILCRTESFMVLTLARLLL